MSSIRVSPPARLHVHVPGIHQELTALITSIVRHLPRIKALCLLGKRRRRGRRRGWWVAIEASRETPLPTSATADVRPPPHQSKTLQAPDQQATATATKDRCCMLYGYFISVRKLQGVVMFCSCASSTFSPDAGGVVRMLRGIRLRGSHTHTCAVSDFYQMVVQTNLSDPRKMARVRQAARRLNSHSGRSKVLSRTDFRCRQISRQEPALPAIRTSHHHVSEKSRMESFCGHSLEVISNHADVIIFTPPWSFWKKTA